MEADLVAGMVRILSESNPSGSRAAELAGVPEAELSRVRVGFSRESGEAGAAHA